MRMSLNELPDAVMAEFNFCNTAAALARARPAQDFAG
jgi:hypothetical protein